MPTNRRHPTFPSLADISLIIPPVTWLWPGWIPRGMLTLLCAAPGAGKSYFALDLARRLIHGLPWPDGAPSTASAAADAHASAEPKRVVYVDAEAAPALLNARAIAWGLDRSHLYPLSPFSASDGLLDFNQPIWRDRLTAMVAALRPPLVIIDSLGSALHGGENQVSTVDLFFGYLNDLAVHTQSAILILHHLNKQEAFSGALPNVSISSNQVRGSGHIVSLARSVLALTDVRPLAPVQIALDPQTAAPRRLQIIKTNLIANHSTGPHGSGGPIPLDVTFATAPNGAAELTYAPAAPTTPRPRTQVESCARWLLDYLTRVNVPVQTVKLQDHAHRAGYSRNTLYRARELLGPQIIDTRARHAEGNCWVLPPWPRPQPPAPDQNP